jgi:uncharacterized protein (TIGR03084 family)
VVRVPTPDLDAILTDLAAEHASLDAIVAPLSDAQWATPTPAEGWTVHDQVAHVAYFDGEARRAVIDPDGFAVGLAGIATDPDGWMRRAVEEGRARSSPEVLAWWRDHREQLLEAARPLDPKARIAWYGPPMSVLSFLSARLMETWIHGQDVVDALGVEREPTARLRHVAHIAVRARAFNYAQRGRELPAGEVRVELRAPDGSLWTWGAEDAADRVSGEAFDFCLVATQRRHVLDTDLTIAGPLAEEWMGIAQAYAGPPGPGRQPGQFPKRSSAVPRS